LLFIRNFAIKIRDLFMKTSVLEELGTAQKVFVPFSEEVSIKYQMTAAEENAVLRGLNDKKLGKVSSQEEVEQEMELFNS
jgi:hypothetical protein